MTPFEIKPFRFTKQSVSAWAASDPRNSNWPVVYVLDSGTKSLGTVYVGESLNAANRMKQHLESHSKVGLTSARVILDDKFNKSVCLDLESFLIRLLSGDGTFEVLNGNAGITDADYYDRTMYRETFREVFEQLKNQGVFTRSIPEIENSDLFKLSPFKALSQDQAVAVEGIMEGLADDLRANAASTVVVQGEPGTGKTVIAIFLLKLIADVANSLPEEEPDADSMFSEFFLPGNRELFTGLKVGLVIPQQSLRKSVQKVFKKTPGLHASMVLTPFAVGESDEMFDILVVDETHRLNQRANQPSGPQNKKFSEITHKLFGWDDKSKTQLDWIRARSRHQILLLDAAQAVRPADLPLEQTKKLADSARSAHRYYPLATQMRVKAGADYVGWVRKLLTSPDRPIGRPALGEYDFRFFESLSEMRDEIHARDAEFGLSRMVAGYAWPWKTKKDPTAFDIAEGGLELPWNGTQVDWIASPNSLNEVGSIHTVQGYDLNYAGVIIGPDLRYDTDSGIYFDRDNYFDTKGKENNKVLGKKYSDNELLPFVQNIYAVLLTRGIRGTYIYVSDPALRLVLSKVIGR